MAYAGEGSPWWRVLRAGGHPPRGHEARAHEHYLAEGTPLISTQTDAGYRVDYANCRYRPWETQPSSSREGVGSGGPEPHAD